jgi:hypothetical protein
MSTLLRLLVLPVVLLVVACSALAQSQGSVSHTFNPEGGSGNPVGADIAPPAGSPDGTTVEITKIEEKDTAGNWHDVTAGWTRKDNPSAKVNCKVDEPGTGGLTNKTIRFSWKTNNTITGNPSVTQVY